MVDFRPVLRIVGWVLCLLAAAMLPPAVADAVAGDGEWLVFLLSSGLTLFVGLAMELGMRERRWVAPTMRQAYLATALGWIVPCLFAALPFAFGKPQLSGADALFEATCGVTTTGATVLAALDRLPPGLLLWRGLLQWLGGGGVVLTAVAVLPILRVGGMQIFRIEIRSAKDRAAPRATRIGTTLISVYAALTAALAVLLWLVGMPAFDAMVHAMAAISTGGFSTWDSSLAHFNSARIDLIAAIGMILGGMPFLLFFHVAQGKFGAILRNSQVRWYLGVMLAATLVVMAWLVSVRHFELATAFRHAGFTVASVMTGTGFASIDYSTWGGVPAAVLLFLTLVGGCAGSTTGGAKIFRLQLLLAEAMVQMRLLLRPHAVMIARFNKRPIPKDVLESAMGFLFVYAVGFAVLAMGLGLLGLDFVTAISGAAGAIANLGPGLGPVIGPSGSFAVLPDGAKFLLIAGMLFGRVELFPLLVLCVPTFWKQ
jgi:trk system potassium uptake protein